MSPRTSKGHHSAELTEITQFFDALADRLRDQPWFDREGWIARHHKFASGITFHVYKSRWMNEDTRGIHFETYLDPKAIKLGRTYVAVHLFHTPTIPGTKLKRMAVSKPFVDAIEKTVRKRNGFEFRAGKYGLQPFKKMVSVHPLRSEKLFSEFSWLCRELGPALDQTLIDVLGR